MGDFGLEVKLPQDLIDIIPQERITGDILRGHGPRRGNLETLLRYWRPIMRKPGGFRRCIVILANHPELYPLQRICAWLHHETTGKWPNEGNHHGVRRGGGRAGRVLRRAIPGKRKRRRGKSDGGVEIASWRIYRRLGGMATRPIDGDQNAVEYKAARFKQGCRSVPMPGSFEWDEHYVRSPLDTLDFKRLPRGPRAHGRGGRFLSSLASFFTPGDMGKYRSPGRSLLWGALTPGGGGLGGGFGGGMGGGVGGGGIGGGLPTIAAAEALRCPSGYLNGGRFTDPKLTNCGGVIFDSPSQGPGAVTEVDVEKMTRRFESAQAEDLPDLVRDIVINKPQGDPFAVIREAAMRPKTKPNIRRRDSSTTDVVSHLSENENETRLVRRDGAVLEPMLGPEALARIDHDSIKDSIYVTSKIPEQGQMTGDEVRLLTRGAKAIVYVFPEGSVTLSRKKDLDVATASRIRTRWGGLVRHASLSHNPAEAMLRLAKEFADSLSVSTDFRNMPGADERIVVYNVTGERRIVSRWIFQMFLSLRAPRRPLGVVKPFSLVPPGEEEGGPTKSEYWRPERGQYAVLGMERKALSLQLNPVPWKGSVNLSSVLIGEEYRKESLIDFKAAKFGRALEDPEMMIKGLLRGRMRGRRISNLARRMPKVVPYNPDAVDGEGDGLVQDGTIWERPVGTRFANLNGGARRLLVGAYLINKQGERVDYLPGQHPKSPIGQTYQPKLTGARKIGASIAERGRRGGRQVIHERDVRRGAQADFTPQQARAELRRLDLQRRMRRIRTQPEYRSRRADRLQRRGERNLEVAEERFAEARGRATERNAERQEREERQEVARAPRRARREMSFRHRDEAVAETERETPEGGRPSARERRERSRNQIARQDRERAELNLESPSALRRRRGERVIRRGERREERRTPVLNLRSLSDEDLAKERSAIFRRHYDDLKRRGTYTGIADLPDELQDIEEELKRRKLRGPSRRDRVAAGMERAGARERAARQERERPEPFVLRRAGYGRGPKSPPNPWSGERAITPQERVRRVAVGLSDAGERIRERYKLMGRKNVKDKERVVVAEQLEFPTGEVEQQLSLFSMPNPSFVGDSAAERLADATYSGLVDASDDSQETLDDWKKQMNRIRLGVQSGLRTGVRVDADDDIDDLIRATGSPFDADKRMVGKSREMLMVGDLWIGGESPVEIGEAQSVEELMEAVEDNISFVAKPAELLARLEMIMDGLGSARAHLRDIDTDDLIGKRLRRWVDSPGENIEDDGLLTDLLKARVLAAVTAEGTRDVRSAHEAALRVVSGLRTKRVDDVDGPEKARIEVKDAQILARIVAPQMRARLETGKAVRVESGNHKWTFADYGVDIDDVFQRVADGTPLRERDVEALEALVNDAFLLGRVIRSTRDPKLEFLIVDRSVDPASVKNGPANAPLKVLQVRRDKGKIEVRFSGKILARRSGGSTLYGEEQVSGFGWSDVGSIERSVSWTARKGGGAVGKIDNVELDLDRPGSETRGGPPIRVKNMGLSTIVGSHAELSLSATGVVESTLSGKDEGLLAFGMAGFRNLDAEERMMGAIGEAVRSYRIDGPSGSQIILNDNMANALEELLDIHNRHDDVSFLHVHQVLNDSRFLPKGGRRHPWRVTDKPQRDEDLFPYSGVAEADRYGDWWVANAPFRDGSVRLDGEVGEWLEEARSGPRIFNTDLTEGYQAARTPGDPDRHRGRRKPRSGRRPGRRHGEVRPRDDEPPLEQVREMWLANEHMLSDEQLELVADGMLSLTYEDGTEPSPTMINFWRDLARESLVRRNEDNRPDQPEQEELLGLSGPNFTAKDTQHGRVNPDDHRLGWYPNGLDPRAVHEMSLSDAEVLLSEIEAAIRYNVLEDLDIPQIIVPDRNDLRPSLRKLNNAFLEDIKIGVEGKVRRGEEPVPRGVRRSAWRMERDPDFYREYLKKGPQGRQKHIDDIPGFFLSELSRNMAKELKKGRWILEFDGGDLDFRFNEDRFDVVGYSLGEVLLRAKERGIGYEKGDYLRIPIHTEDDSREARLAKKSRGLPFPPHSPVWIQWQEGKRTPTRGMHERWWNFTDDFLRREWPKAQKERWWDKGKRPPMGRDYSGESLEEWNQMNLSDGSFVGADSSEADLHKTNLSGSDLSKSKFVGADLGESNIERSDFTESDLSEVEMTDAMASHGIFRKTMMEGGQFARTDFRNASFFGAKASGANFEEANLAGADMSVMDLQGAILVGAVLQGANLDGADLTGADLTGADLRGVDLSRAILTDAILTDANGWRTVWPEGFDPVEAGVDLDAPLGRWPGGGPIDPGDLDPDDPTIRGEAERLLGELTEHLTPGLIEAIDPEQKKDFFEGAVKGVDEIIANLSPGDGVLGDEDTLRLYRSYRDTLILAESMDTSQLKTYIEMLSRIDEGELPGGLDPRDVGTIPHLMAPARDGLEPIQIGRLSGYQHALMINWELKKDTARREMRRAASRLSQEELGKKIEAMDAMESGAVIMDMPEMGLGDDGLILFGDDEEYLFVVRKVALSQVYSIRNGQDHLGETQFRPGNNPYSIDAEGDIVFNMDMNVEGAMDVEAAGMVREVEEHLAGAVHPDDQPANKVPGGGGGAASQNEKVRRLSEIDAEIDRLVGGGPDSKYPDIERRDIDMGAEDLSGATRRESLREQFGDMEPEDVERLGRLLDERVAINNSWPKDYDSDPDSDVMRDVMDRLQGGSDEGGDALEQADEGMLDPPDDSNPLDAAGTNDVINIEEARERRRRAEFADMHWREVEDELYAPPPGIEERVAEEERTGIMRGRKEAYEAAEAADPEYAARRARLRAELERRQSDPRYEGGAGPHGEWTDADEAQERAKEKRKERGWEHLRSGRRAEFKAMSDEELEDEREMILIDHDEAALETPGDVRSDQRPDVRPGGMIGYYAEMLTDLEEEQETRTGVRRIHGDRQGSEGILDPPDDSNPLQAARTPGPSRGLTISDLQKMDNLRNLHYNAKRSGDRAKMRELEVEMQKLAAKQTIPRADGRFDKGRVRPDAKIKTRRKWAEMEVERQGAPKSEVEGFLSGWEHAEASIRGGGGGRSTSTRLENGRFTEEAVIEIHDYVDQRGRKEYRTTPVTFANGTKAMSAELIPRAMENLMQAHKDGDLTPEEFVEEFLKIHPFEDGNGRTASILLNALEWQQEGSTGSDRMFFSMLPKFFEGE